MTYVRPVAFFGVLLLLAAVPDGELKFQHHFISLDLPIGPQGTGDYGLTALVDLDRDGRLDFVLGGRFTKPSQLYWFEYQGPDQWAKHVVGSDYQSDVGLAALDVDGDGWTDLVCSGVWYRNTGKPKTEPFERIVFADKASGAHDIIVADIDGDGDLDIVCADTWYENADGKGLRLIPHANIPFGRVGPYGKCVRTAIVDIDGDGKRAIVMADADISDSHVVVLRNADGKGGSWTKQELPQSFKYGSLHALAVADLNGDGRPDIVVNEQEELLPEGRQNPRWIVWVNEGGGKFTEHILLDDKLGGHELQVGDVDGDGDIDICSKPWGTGKWNKVQGKMHVDFLENRLKSK